MDKLSELIDISVVIPLFNEEESLSELHERLTKVLSKLNRTWEIIFIDDGSNDKSNSILLNLRTQDPHTKVITFRRNQGKSAALQTGFQAASGNFVITMDADLQDDPDELPNLVHKLESGFDLVSGWKQIRHDPVSKTIPSKLFNYVTSKLSGIKLHDFNCGLKIYRNEVVKSLDVYGERHRFLPVLAHMQGFNVGELAVTHHPRKFGKTKFGMYRFIAGFFDLITLLFRMKFLTKPLHFFGLLGLISLLSGLGILAYLSIGWFYGKWIGNRPILIISVMAIITGVQLFTLGLLAEMITGSSRRDKLPIREDSDITLTDR